MAKKVTKPSKTQNRQRDLLLTPCKNKQELKNWIKYFLGLEMPDCTVSRYADTNPLDVIWEVYSICTLKNNPEDIQELLYVAGRGSGKTLGMAIVEFMVMLHDHRDAVHVGAILNQAKRCYDYIVKFILSRKIKIILNPGNIPTDARILQKMNMEKSIFQIDGTQVTLEVLPCTLKATNGPHVPLVVVDEIDTVSGEAIKAFKEISGMVDSKGGKQALRIGISTRKTLYGLMNSQMENADKENRTVRRWTAFEFTERCPDSKSGIDKVDMYIIQDIMEAVTEEVWKKKDETKQKEYVKYEMFEGCIECPLASICLTDAKKQKSTSFMLKTLKELEQKVLTEGADWALAQLMNLKPSLEGIIYREYDPVDHFKNWNEMWQLLTGTVFPGECTHDIFVKKCHELELPCYAGIDWGWSKPSTVVYFFIDKRDNVFIVRADGMTFVNDPKWVHYIKTKYHYKYRCQLYFPDVANGSAIDIMKQAGLPVANKQDKSINLGIQVIKKMLRIPGIGTPKLFLAKETCVPLHDEFQRYHYKIDSAGTVTDIPETEYDHYLDALRYPMTMLLGKMVAMLSSFGDNDTERVVDKDGNFVHIPSACQYAETQGIIFNDNAEDMSKLGKIGTLDELDDDDGDEGGGDGGFLWGFD